MIPIGASWEGAGDHIGHTVTKIEDWPPRSEDAPDEYRLADPNITRITTCGRVRCTCGDEWNAGFWPLFVRLPKPLIGPGIE